MVQVLQKEELLLKDIHSVMRDSRREIVAGDALLTPARNRSA